MLTENINALPAIIQGGMGVAVSSWVLARAVAASGQLGVVSGTALDVVLSRRLQMGDPGGHVRAALAAFPVPDVAKRIYDRYFRAEGHAPGTPYAATPRMKLAQGAHAQELTIVANFAEVWLAKQGHGGPVGVNFLEKIQMATPAATYGALLAGVDVVLMGAGIPREMPSLLNALTDHKPVSLPIEVAGAPADQSYTVDLDPIGLLGEELPALERPAFLAIVSAHVLAEYLARDPRTRPDGFVVEGPPAGGHNAPPRGKVTLDENGEPVYGPRDNADLDRMKAVGLPFWLAGQYGTPERLREAQAGGAAGIQAGTLFALSKESGLRPDLREQMLDKLRDGTLNVRTDPTASPTGFPFKLAELPGTLADRELGEARLRLCDLGHLRVPFMKADKSIDYRCPSEPVQMYLKKGGSEAETTGRNCLCNGLMANIGMGQTRKADGYTEQPLVTLGSSLDGAHSLLKKYPEGWSATEAISWLLGE